MGDRDQRLLKTELKQKMRCRVEISSMQEKVQMRLHRPGKSGKSDYVKGD